MICAARHRPPSATVMFATCERARGHSGPHVSHIGTACYGTVVSWD